MTNDLSPHDPLLAQQRRRNEALRDGWERFAGHRARVMELLLAAAAGRHAPRLCLLGAGNANDIDLPALLAAYARIDLVDYDGLALAEGVARQTVAGHGAIALHGGVDLRNCDDLASLSAAASTSIGACDVVASLCLLSQLVEQAAGGTSDPAAALPRIKDVRQAHLHLMTQGLAPGGEAILITDFVSSQTAPALETVDDRDLPALLQQCLAAGNFFTGLHPGVLVEQLLGDPALRQQVDTVTPHAPWRWNLGPRTYAVFAIRWRRK